MSRSSTAPMINDTGLHLDDAAATRIRTDDKLTLKQLCAELQIARSTFYDWRAKGRGPRCIKLPNGDLRVRRQDLEHWLEHLEDRDS